MPTDQLYFTVFSRSAMTYKNIMKNMKDIESYTYLQSLSPNINPEGLLIFVEWDSVPQQTIKLCQCLNSFTVLFSFENSIPKIYNNVFSMVVDSINNLSIYTCALAHQSSLQKIKNYLGLVSGSDHRFIPVNQIVYLKADNNYTEIYLMGNRFIQAFSTLKSFQQRLPLHFWRVHKSYLINTLKVHRIKVLKRQVFFENHPAPALFSKSKRNKINNLLAQLHARSY